MFIQIKGEIDMSSIDRAIIAELNKMCKDLNKLQKDRRVQKNQRLKNELGEIMGNINNAASTIKSRKRFKTQLLMYELGETMSHIDSAIDTIRSRKRFIR